jgi:hypothetical protein
MRRSVLESVVVGAALAALVLLPHHALAWGPEGHRVIAAVADRILQRSDAAAHDKILALLATDKSKWTKTDIASEATWADVLRDKSEEARIATAGWHYVPLKADGPDLARDCNGRPSLPTGYPASRGRPENCAVDKVEQFIKELQNPDTLPGERLAALQFLINLAGDLNDPVNAIDRGDQHGRCVAIQVGGKAPVRLAAYWGVMLVTDVAGHDPAAAATKLVAGIKPEEIEKWSSGGPEEWARDSYEIAKTAVYSFAKEPPAGKYSFPAAKGEKDSCGQVDLYKVGLDYETKALGVVKEQLAKGGLRLARVLRDSFK